MLKPNIRKVLTYIIEKIKDENVAIAFSGGIDSLSILYTCMDLKKKITLYSFTLDNHVSTDFSSARRFAKYYNINFVPIFLPTDINTIKNDLRFIKTLGAIKKTDFVCSWPMLHLYKNIKENILINGLGADGHFCISKKGMIHYKDKIQEFRDGLFLNENYAQKLINIKMAKYYNKTTIIPYLEKQMIKEFKDTTWDSINKPRQKQATLNNYKDYFSRIKVRNHINLQLGDSKIEKNLEQLINSDWNVNNYKSIVGIFNDLNRGIVK
tara:strand:+ start:1260 stop:2060 length:801 start_codon:yes stop_codon:yes gene_type:complete